MKCPTCYTEINIEESNLGEYVNCPNCNEELEICTLKEPATKKKKKKSNKTDDQVIITVRVLKSRGIYIIFAIFFFGLFGAHNFYSGHYKTGVLRFLSVIFCFIWPVIFEMMGEIGIGYFLSVVILFFNFISVILDTIRVKEDAYGNAML